MAYDHENGSGYTANAPKGVGEQSATGRTAQPERQEAYRNTCARPPLKPLTPPTAMHTPTGTAPRGAGANARDAYTDPYDGCTAEQPAAAEAALAPESAAYTAMAAQAAQYAPSEQPQPAGTPWQAADMPQSPSQQQDIPIGEGQQAERPATGGRRVRVSACNACDMPRQRPIGAPAQWGTVAGSEHFLPTFTQATPGAEHSGLTPDQFAAALGSPRAEGGVDADVTDAFARAWAADGDVLHYRGDLPDDETTQRPRAPSGVVSWQPMTQEQLQMQRKAFAAEGLASQRGEPDDKLFKAYGGSYAEAYDVARAMQFHEQRPLPDDTTGDISGMVDSILHTPSGEPILLGSVMVQEGPNEEEADAADPAGPVEAPLPLGRKIARACLLTLGAAALGVAGLYFAGFIP